jgi:hypothetical protein
MADAPQPHRRGTPPGLLFLRYWLPGLICLVGLIYGATRNFDELGLEAAVLGVAAGSSLWLITVLMRVGIAGDRDRDREDEARAYFDEHGRWPDER